VRGFFVTLANILPCHKQQAKTSQKDHSKSDKEFEECAIEGIYHAVIIPRLYLFEKEEVDIRKILNRLLNIINHLLALSNIRIKI
jgi:hypothetical protein